ncbi:hypothetical protein HDU86_002826 [Geranomyces michiganensis]|nr:hypothetical protein HDU86_002826 [Geranomyces michiganensis]
MTHRPPGCKKTSVYSDILDPGVRLNTCKSRNTINPTQKLVLALMTADRQSSIRVAVIGAGIAGTTLYQILRGLPGVQVDLFERENLTRPRGATGFRLLIAPDLVDQFKLHLPPDVYALFLDSLGAPIEKISVRLRSQDNRVLLNVPDDRRDLSGAVTASRWRLRRALLGGQDANDPHIHFGKVFRNYTVHPARATSGTSETTVEFEDGTSFVADLVVGADGATSKVASQLLGGRRQQDETGVWNIYAKIPFTPETEALLPYTDGHTMIWGHNQNTMVLSHFLALEDAAFLVDPQCPLRPDPKDPNSSFKMVGLGAPITRFLSRTPPSMMSPDELREEMIARTKGWHWDIRRLVELAEPASFNAIPMWSTRRFEKSWTSGPVTILGDAVHSMVPTLGKGAATALQDAFTLRDVLAEATVHQRPLSVLPGLLEAYELRIMAAGFQVADASMKMFSLSYFSANPIQRWVRDALLRCMEAWFGVKATAATILGRRSDRS